MKLLHRFIYPLLLTLVVLAVVITNYVPGTWLSGWDNIHAEFNFPVNISRAFFSAWQEYQGTGLLAGMGHGADFFRQVFLWVTSIIVPTELSRYFFHFLMLVVGTLGMYWISKDFLLPKSARYLQFLAAIAALFYLLNLGTVQFFYTPYEAFSTFWGLFPWELYSVFLFLEKRTPRNLLILAVVHWLASAQGLVQVFFLVYAIFLGIVLLNYWYKHKSIQATKVVGILIAVVLCMNAYWILINGYFTVTNVKVTQNAMINKMNVDRIFQLNRARGNLLDVATLRQFNYDFVIETASGKPEFLMKPWIHYYDSPPIIALSLLVFALAFIGLATYRGKYQFAVLGMVIVVAVAFLTDTPGFDLANSVIRSVPLLNQVFRNSFTKFVVPLAFVYSVGLSFGLYYILHLKKIHQKKILHLVVCGIVVVAIFVLSIPTFQGNFFSPTVRSAIPKEYFETFKYFERADKNARIMNLPQEGFWGWGLYKWGPVGSGFLWYGIEQPIMDRAFDVWSDDLENYYWQLVYAIRRKDIAAFDQILEKYQITHVLFDTSYVPSDSYPRETLLMQKDFLERSTKISLDKKLNNVSIYKVDLKNQNNNFISFRKTVPNILNDEPFSNQDNAFAQYGPYYTEMKSLGNEDTILPFGSLFTNRFANEEPFKIDNEGQNIVLNKDVKIIPSQTYTLSFKPSNQEEQLALYNVYVTQVANGLTVRLQQAPPRIEINGETIDLSPQSKTIPVQTSSQKISGGVLLSFQNNQILSLSKLTGSEQLAGKIYIDKNDSPVMKIYSLNPVGQDDLSLNSFEPAQVCLNSITGSEPYVNRIIQNGNLILEATNASSCVRYSQTLNNSLSEGLIGVSFKYQSTNQEKANYCLKNGTQTECLNKKSTPDIGFSAKEKHINTYFPFTTSTKPNDFTIALDPVGTDALNRITYKNIALNYFQPIASVSLTDIAGDLQETSFPLRSDSENLRIKISVPTETNTYSYPSVISNGNFNLAQSDTYTQFKGNTYSRFQDGKVKLLAQNASLTFWLDFPNTLAQNGYILKAETENLNGFPSYIHIGTYDSNLLYAYTQLPSGQAPKSSFYILPPGIVPEKGIRVLFDTTSVNRNPSVNTVNNVTLYPFPYSFLTSISIQKQRPPIGATPAESNFKVNHIHPGLYSIHGITSGSGILELAQAYDAGWQAYQVQDGSSSLSLAFPFIFGKIIPEHVSVNNWSNGWNIPSEGNKDIILVYMPQYIQYLGFIIWIVALGTLSYYGFKKPHEILFGELNHTKIKLPSGS